jgi:PKD repeat protein
MVALMGLVGAAGCTQKQKEGDSSSYLIMQSLQASAGAEPDKFSDVLGSDVRTFGAVYDDLVKVNLKLGLKDPGSTTNPSVPTSANFVTVSRYRVVFTRPDGRNTPGVDVPAPFEGAATFTVTETGGTGVMTLVRAQAKTESPLSALAGQGGTQFIPAIAQVTLDGTDQAGRAVTVQGSISVNFADWIDPGDDPEPPAVSFTVSPTTPRVNTVTQFDGTASTVPAGRTIVSYTWDFGDGTFAQGGLVSHVYLAPGNYTVTLLVRDSAGQVMSLSRTVTVLP